jgi:hypothetical protein
MLYLIQQGYTNIVLRAFNLFELAGFVYFYGLNKSEFS